MNAPATQIDCHENFPARHGDFFVIFLRFCMFTWKCFVWNIWRRKINRIGEWHNRLDVCGMPVGIRKIFSLFRSSILQAFAASSCFMIFRAWLWKWEKERSSSSSLTRLFDSRFARFSSMETWRLQMEAKTTSEFFKAQEGKGEEEEEKPWQKLFSPVLTYICTG